MAISRTSVVTYANSFNNAYTLTNVSANVGDLIIVACAGRTSTLFDWPTPTWNGETFTVVSEVVAEPIGLEVYKLTAGSTGTYNITATASDYGGVVAMAIVYSGSDLDIDGVQTGEWYTGTYSLPSETVAGYVSGNVVADFLVATLRNDGDVDVPDTLYITNGTNVSTINSEAGRVGRMYYSEHTSGAVSYTKSDSETPKYRIAAFRIFEGGPAVTINSTPADIRVTESRTIRVTAPTTAMTTGNTTVKVNNSGNDPITPSAVTNISGLTYDVLFTVPDAYEGLAYSATGYPIIVTTTDGSVTSSNVDFLPVTGNDFVVLTAAPGDFNTSLGTLAIGDIIEWETNSGEITVNSDATITSTNPNTTFEARAWDATDSTYGAWALQTLGTGGGGGSTGNDSMVEYGLINYGLAKYGVA